MLFMCKNSTNSDCPHCGQVRGGFNLFPGMWTTPLSSERRAVLAQNMRKLWCNGKSTRLQVTRPEFRSLLYTSVSIRDLKQVMCLKYLICKTSELDKIRLPLSDSPGMFLGYADTWAPLYPIKSHSLLGGGRSGRWSLERRRDPKSTFLLASQVSLVRARIWDRWSHKQCSLMLSPHSSRWLSVVRCGVKKEVISDVFKLLTLKLYLAKNKFTHKTLGIAHTCNLFYLLRGYCSRFLWCWTSHPLNSPLISACQSAGAVHMSSKSSAAGIIRPQALTGWFALFSIITLLRWSSHFIKFTLLIESI